MNYVKSKKTIMTQYIHLSTNYSMILMCKLEF